MLKNYIVTTIRNCIRNKTITVINLAGFTAGIIFTIYIFYFIKNEITYEKFVPDYEKVYRVLSIFNESNFDAVPLPITECLRNQFPQVKFITHFSEKELHIKSEINELKQLVQFVDKDFFKIFHFIPISGGYSNFDLDLNSALISKNSASLLFGNKNPIGKTVSIEIGDRITEFRIDGLLENAPPNSSINLSILLPYANYRDKVSKLPSNDWLINQYSSSCFLMLNNKINKNIVENRLKDILKPNIIPSYENKYSFYLQNISEIHFDNETSFSKIKTSDKKNVLILTGLVLFIMIITSFNYINLTVAKSYSRLKEIGIRKTSGALRKNIITQFIIESFITVMISFMLSLFLTPLLLSFFNSLLGEKIKIDFGTNQASIILIGIMLTLSVIIGILPAIRISKHLPQTIIQGYQKNENSKLIPRIFICLQFAISTFLLFGTIILNLQFNFIKSNDIGFNKDNVIMIKASEMFGRIVDGKTISGYKNEILMNPFIRNATAANIVLGGKGLESGFRFDYRDKYLFSNIFSLDPNTLTTMHLKMIKGKNFNENRDNSNSIIVNETFVKQLKIQEPLSAEVSLFVMKKRNMKIIGVLKDFHYLPLRDSISPAAFMFLNLKKGTCEYIYVRVNRNNVNGAISFLKEKWEKFFPNQAFDYQFLDERIDSLYKSERKWKDLINYSSVAAIFFACMGLFGLVLFSAERRTKEIGIRKVLGASVFEVSNLLVKEYLILIIISLAISLPLAYYFSNKWLQDFAYRIEISWWVFVLSGGIALVIALLTVSFQAIKAATANPVEALRYE